MLSKCTVLTNCVSEPDWPRAMAKLCVYMLAVLIGVKWMKKSCFNVKFIIINKVKVFCHVRTGLNVHNQNHFAAVKFSMVNHFQIFHDIHSCL